MKHIILGSLAIASFASGLSYAQEAPPVAQAAAPTTQVATQVAAVPAPQVPVATCELHVFPTLEGQAQTSGWLSSMGVIGAIADASANKDRNVSEAQYLKEALGPRLQIEALKSVDLINSLGLPAGTAISYETPIADRKITTEATNRLTGSTAPCYAELIITQNFYAKRPIYGRSLNNRFIFKDFRTGKSNTSLFKGRGGNGLQYFPPKTTDETDAAESDLRTAFAKNFTEYASMIRSGK